MRRDAGMSLAELVIVLAVIAILIAVATAYSIPWLGKEEMRSSLYRVQTFLQIARIQAISRNRDCLFRIDGGNGHVQVLDLNDPGNSFDDLLLSETVLPAAVSFARPDGVSPITLDDAGGGLYTATFASDGSVPEGAGEVGLRGGERFGRVILHGAGGVRTERWDGAAWLPGS
ncbi:MAG: GspH/FimT family pseudopilin [Candidatus Polarisedimenticolia bacterium]